MSAAASFVAFAPDDVPDAVPDPETLGAKGASLVAMTRLGLPVPPGFVVPVLAAQDEGRRERALRDGLAWLRERTAGPVVSVRSGASLSMPGMMDTILNIGARGGPTPFERDCRRRFLQGWGAQVRGLPRATFDEAAEDSRNASALMAHLEALVPDVPDDLDTLVAEAARAVAASWDSERARAYRQMTGMEGAGTAIVVQTMVYGNRDERSATGVMNTRDPRDGTPRPSGEYLARAQGEDVVSGFVTPLALTEEDKERIASREPSFEALFADAFDELIAAGRTLEKHWKDAQEIEFTLDSGRLFLLQSRPAKRDAEAGFRIAVDLVREGVIDEREAVRRTRPQEAASRLTSELAPDAEADIIARGLPASGGAAAGRVALTSEEAEGMEGPCVLVRPETDPNDVAGMNAAVAVLTARGGNASHAASVARALGRPCITGAGSLEIGATGFASLGRQVQRGDWITIDGTRGVVHAGKLPLKRREPSPALGTLLEWGR